MDPDMLLEGCGTFERRLMSHSRQYAFAYSFGTPSVRPIREQIENHLYISDKTNRPVSLLFGKSKSHS